MDVNTEEKGTEQKVQTEEGDGEMSDLTVMYEAYNRYPNIADYDGRTLLHLAVVENKIEVVQYVVEEWKVDLTATDRWGRTAHDEASRVKNFEYLKAGENSPGCRFNEKQE